MRKQAQPGAFLRGHRNTRMKQANNNEVDLLLRAFAKGREGSTLRSALTAGDRIDGGNGGAEDHLDADELNSYAEGVVPAPARARYMEHLAECDSCRRVVIDLSQAAGAANRFDVPAQPKGAGFWQSLTAFFSPAVLRYAVPVLVLTLVVGIGLVSVLRERGQDLVAKNQTAAPAPAQEQLKRVEAPAGNASGAAQPAPTTNVPTGGSTPTLGGLLTDRDDRTQQPPADRPVPGSSTTGEVGGVATTSTISKDGTVPAKAVEGADESRPSNVAESKAAAPAPPPVAQVELDRADLAKERSQKTEDRERQPDSAQRGSFRNAPVEEHGPNRSAAPRSAVRRDERRATNEPDGRGPNAGAKNAEKKAKVGEVETRSVSGRHFVRENNAWVDDAFEGGQATVKVSRNSEQFRALVADEPGLRRIANELNGVVIVVWKNRAYRIQ